MVASLKAEYLQSEVKYLTRNTQLLGKISLWTPTRQLRFFKADPETSQVNSVLFFHLSKAILYKAACYSRVYTQSL